MLPLQWFDRVGGSAGVTQLVECLLPKQDVAGSSPVTRLLSPVFTQIAPSMNAACGQSELLPRARRLEAPRSLRLGDLVQMRWCALAGQLAVFIAARFGLGLQLDWLPLLTILTIGAASNLVLAVYPHGDANLRWVIGSVLLLDIVLLTGLLSFYGGHSNPFSLFYLVHVVLAAFLLGVRWMWVILGASSFGYMLQFFIYVPIHALHQHGEVATDLHLKGMLVAFVLVAMLLGYFLSQMRSALDSAREEIRSLEQRAHRDEKLLALSTLSAGAAHELRTPLATVKVVVDEMAKGSVNVERSGIDKEDIALLQREVLRCEGILRSMSGASGDIEGEMPHQCSLTEVIEGAVKELTAQQHARLLVQGADPWPVVLPVRSVQRMLLSLIRNAFDASEPAAMVRLVVQPMTSQIQVSVQDCGCGMSQAVLARLGEPFFSTKPVGAGMGLGVFLVKRFLSSCGGTFEVDSGEGKGTTITVRLPRVFRYAEAA